MAPWFRPTSRPSTRRGPRIRSNTSGSTPNSTVSWGARGPGSPWRPLAAVKGDEAERRVLKPLAPDAVYEIRWSASCFGRPEKRKTRFRTARAAPLPTKTLGRLTVGPLGRGEELVAGEGSINGFRSSCQHEIDVAYVDLDIALDPAVKPWREALIDGATWVASRRADAGAPGASRPWDAPAWSVCGETPKWNHPDRGGDRLYAVCRGYSPTIGAAFDEGRYEAVVKARVVGERNTLRSNAVRVELSCREGVPVSDEGCSLVSSARGRRITAPGDRAAALPACGRRASRGSAHRARGGKPAGASTQLIRFSPPSMPRW